MASENKSGANDSISFGQFASWLASSDRSLQDRELKSLMSQAIGMIVHMEPQHSKISYNALFIRRNLSQLHSGEQLS
jgi:hypothetical protein